MFFERSEALRAARGTLAEAGGSSAAARATSAVARATASGAPFSFDAPGLRVTTVGISVSKDELDSVRTFLTSV